MDTIWPLMLWHRIIVGFCVLLFRRYMTWPPPPPLGGGGCGGIASVLLFSRCNYNNRVPIPFPVFDVSFQEASNSLTIWRRGLWGVGFEEPHFSGWTSLAMRYHTLEVWSQQYTEYWAYIPVYTVHTGAWIYWSYWRSTSRSAVLTL